MEVTAAWVRGQRFANVMQLGQDIFEGSLVRALRRTEELMGQVCGCCTGLACFTTDTSCRDCVHTMLGCSLLE